MAEVDILLATFNGEKFIASQLHSLLMQSFRDFRILVHDDGSYDKTLDIVRNFARSDSRIVIIEDGIRFGSPQKNFMHLLSFAIAPWIMFCDQDDIWFDNKVEFMLMEGKNCPSDIPCVIYSQSLIWTPSRGIIGKGGAYRAPRNLNEFMGQKAGVQGCVSMFNKPLRDIMLSFKGHIAMHDHLLEMSALTFGSAIRINIPLMLYRQHENNVTGNFDVALPLKKRLLGKLINSKPVMDASHIIATTDFYRNFSEKMTDDQRRLFEAYLKMPYNNKLQNICTAFRNGMARDQSRLKFLLKILISQYINPENRMKLNQ